MSDIRYIEADDKEFWFKLDKHLPEDQDIRILIIYKNQRSEVNHEKEI